MSCPLCLHPESVRFDVDKARSYEICRKCSLVHVPRSELVSTKMEKDRYEAHENEEASEGYRNYLQQIAATMGPHLPSGSRGLDFGCGKTFLLEKLLEEKGHQVDSFDVFFHPNQGVFNSRYDFIVLSEVIEHLRDPHEEMKKIRGLLRPSGRLFVKTKVLPETKVKFSNWFYKRDITHVQFFNEASLLELARLFMLVGPEPIGNDMYLFRDNG